MTSRRLNKNEEKLFGEDDVWKVLVRGVVVDGRDRARPGLAKKNKRRQSIQCQ